MDIGLCISYRRQAAPVDLFAFGTNHLTDTERQRFQEILTGLRRYERGYGSDRKT